MSPYYEQKIKEISATIELAEKIDTTFKQFDGVEMERFESLRLGTIELFKNRLHGIIDNMGLDASG